jgi:hypothetical protein
VIAALLLVAGLAAVRAGAQAPAPPRAHVADSFNTRVAGNFETGAGVELKLESFNLHEGNSLCPDKVVRPDLVLPGTKKHFCYEAKGLIGTGFYDTEFSFKYKIFIKEGTSRRDSGYVVVGHALVYYTAEDNKLTCAIEKADQSTPPEHLDCQLTTVRDAKRSRDPAPTWKVTYRATPRDLPKVYFIGDSVTAGFGYCGFEGGDNSANVSCGPNQSMANAWKEGPNSLQACAPSEKVKPVNDRCSNNNARGAPWNAGPWFPDPNAPSVAYPYVIAKQQRGALVYDWAMTGATPEDWDPSGGAFGNQLKKIKDSYVVMTLGANPLLAAYIKISLVGFDLIDPGECAASTLIHKAEGRHVATYAAPLDAGEHSGKPGVLRCLDQKWASLHQSTHLVNVYKTLIANGNRVLVLGYPTVCPWPFGTWQPEANLFEGPARGLPCVDRRFPIWGDSRKTLTQWAQAVAIGNDLNAKIDGAVRAASSTPGAEGKIFLALPDQEAWKAHQPWSNDSWVFKNDTWIHPDAAGHRQLAETVRTAMCRRFNHWCGSPPAW